MSRTYNDNASRSTPLQSQADEFTGVDDSTGLFQIDVPFELLGVYLRSQTGNSIDWLVELGLEDPANPGTYTYYNLITETGIDVLWPDFGNNLPRGTRIRVTSSNVVGSNQVAQVIYKQLTD